MTRETEALRDIIDRLTAEAEDGEDGAPSSTKSAAGSAALARAHAQKTAGKGDAAATAMLRAQLLDAEASLIRAEGEAEESKAALAKERKLREDLEARLKAAEAKLAAKGESPDENNAGSAAEAAVANAIAAASAASDGGGDGAHHPHHLGKIPTGLPPGATEVSDGVAQLSVSDADDGDSSKGGKGGKHKGHHKGGLEGFMEGIKNILPKSHDHAPKMSSA